MPNQEPNSRGDETVCVFGLGYVGLPLAIAFAEAGYRTIGYDLSKARVDELNRGKDRTAEVDDDVLARSPATFTDDLERISEATVYINAVPTPVDRANVPDLSHVLGSCRAIGPHLKNGDVFILESTVFPGVTEDYCGPELERHSGLKAGIDFTLGYSPERINPGDKKHNLRSIVKVVSGQDEATADRVQRLYDSVVDAGTYRAPSIRVAEASKVIENIQRDINIALMNDLAMLFDRLDIDTEEVLRASGSKWNFLPFRPGMVGGHCIGVDPYYLIYGAAMIGYHEQMIGAGRRVNDSVPKFIGQRVLSLLSRRGNNKASKQHVAVIGVTFKENVPDIRNSKVSELVGELTNFGLDVTVHDCRADPADVRRQLGLDLAPLSRAKGADCLILAVPHAEYMADDASAVRELIGPDTLVIDIKSGLWDIRHKLPSGDGNQYWAF